MHGERTDGRVRGRDRDRRNKNGGKKKPRDDALSSVNCAESAVLSIQIGMVPGDGYCQEKPKASSFRQRGGRRGRNPRNADPIHLSRYSLMALCQEHV